MRVCMLATCVPTCTCVSMILMREYRHMHTNENSTSRESFSVDSRSVCYVLFLFLFLFHIGMRCGFHLCVRTIAYDKQMTWRFNHSIYWRLNKNLISFRFYFSFLSSMFLIPILISFRMRCVCVCVCMHVCMYSFSSVVLFDSSAARAFLACIQIVRLL